MPDNILIMGGARFHGFQTALSLAREGKTVYVLNRGNYRRDYPAGIIHLRADRNDPARLAQALEGLEFDAVVDNNGYNYSQVKTLLEIIGHRTGHYVFTGTAAVYTALTSSHRLREGEATGTPQESFSPRVLDYARNKFEAEETIRGWGDGLNFTIIRFPNIFGAGDFLGKLSYYYHRFRDGGPVLLEKEVGRFSLICARDAVSVLRKILNNESCFGLTMNAADPEVYDYDDFFSALLGDIYSPGKVILLPAAELWAGGYHQPLAWGPQLNVTRAQEKLPEVKYTPITAWGREALDWGLSHFGDRTLDSGFAAQRNLELNLVEKFALCSEIS